MGYTTYFTGEINIDPPLNPTEIAYLEQFAGTRRMNRSNGPYFIGGEGFCGQGDNGDVIDHNQPDKSQPGLWCQWIPGSDGECLVWDDGEKFYHAGEWMEYIIDHFLRASALAVQSGDPQFKDFQPHICNGTIEASGEESGDIWRIVVTDNDVMVEQAEICWPYNG